MHNELVLRGEVVGPAAIVQVSVAVDGRTYLAARGLPRSGQGSHGWDLHLDTQGWAPGRRVIRVAARDATGAEVATEGEVDLRPYGPPEYSDDGHRAAIAAGRTSMWCEAPWLDGSAKLVAPFWIEGWAWCEAGVEEVTVYVDGIFGCGHSAGSLGRSCVNGWGSRSPAAPGSPPPLIPPSARLGGTPSQSSPPARTGPRWAWAGCRVPSRADALNKGHGPAITPTLVADRYVPEAHVGYSFEPEHHARYRWAALLAPGRRVLDAGSGTGFGTEILARAGAGRADGFDVNLEVVEHARERAGDAADFAVGDLNRIPTVTTRSILSPASRRSSTSRTPFAP